MQSNPSAPFLLVQLQTTGPAREGGAALMRTAEIVIVDELRGLIGDILATFPKRRVAEISLTF